MMRVQGLVSVPSHWRAERARWLLVRQRRAVRAGDGVVTAFRDGQVTLRANRRLDGFTEAVQEIGYQGIRRGDLVIHAMDGFAGAIGVSDSDGKASPVVHAYVGTSEVEVRYLAHVLRQMAVNGYVSSLAKGIRERSTAFDPATLADVVLPVPPLEEQRRIADFVDAETAKFRAIARHRQDQLALLAERRQSMLPLLVSGSHMTAPSRTPFPWYPLLHPEGRMVPLLRVLQLQRGVDLTTDQRQPGTVPVVTTAGIVGEHNRWIVRGPGVVVGRYGSAGAVHWIEQNFWPHNTTLYVKDFRGNDPKYAYYLLKSLPYEMEQARSAIPGLNRNDLHKREVPLLPLKLQRHVVRTLDDRFSDNERAEHALRKSSELLAERYQAVVAAAVCGQLDVMTARGMAA